IERSNIQKRQPVFYNRSDSETPQTVRKNKKPGRNEPCSCGSGKKYKKCCGK
ncbi:MAG: SEC-C domain-containing protein, partial [Nitrospirae bacterium]|nr:SEC-C domain-containing protein [Nitrospirota bacterium]